jgi:hypothetical protein
MITTPDASDNNKALCGLCCLSITASTAVMIAAPQITIISMLQSKSALDGREQLADLGNDHHQRHYQTRDRRQKRLFLSATAHEQLIEYRDNDTDRRYLKYHIYVHNFIP